MKLKSKNFKKKTSISLKKENEKRLEAELEIKHLQNRIKELEANLAEQENPCLKEDSD